MDVFPFKMAFKIEKYKNDPKNKTKQNKNFRPSI